MQPLSRAQRTGQARSALADLAAVQRLTASPVFMAIFDVPFTPLFIAAIFVFHVWLGWFALGAALLLIIASVLNRSNSAQPLLEAAETGRLADRMSGEMQSQAEIIRSLGMQGAAFSRWHRQRNQAPNASMRASDRVGGQCRKAHVVRMSGFSVFRWQMERVPPASWQIDGAKSALEASKRR